VLLRPKLPVRIGSLCGLGIGLEREFGACGGLHGLKEVGTWIWKLETALYILKFYFLLQATARVVAIARPSHPRIPAVVV
jgi:hypothetical protein